MDLGIAPHAFAHILQRHQFVAALFQTIQLGEGGVVQHDALVGIQQHDGLTYGLQHRAGAAVGAQVFLLGHQSAPDLPLHQPSHRAEQQQLHRQRRPAQQRVMHAFGLGARIAQRQQTAFGALQVVHQHTDRVVHGHVVDQEADLLRRSGHRNPLGQQQTPFDGALDASDAHQLRGVVPGQYDQPLHCSQRLAPPAAHALMQRLALHTVRAHQRRRFGIAHRRFQALRGPLHLLAVRDPHRSPVGIACQLLQQQRWHHHNQEDGNRQKEAGASDPICLLGPLFALLDRFPLAAGAKHTSALSPITHIAKLMIQTSPVEP